VFEVKPVRRPKFLCLCVNYRNDAETFEFARQLATLPGYDGDVCVVSNSPSAMLPELLTLNRGRMDDSRLLVLFPDANLGYFGGAAFGLKNYLIENPLPEWVMVSNTDIAFPDHGLFAKLVNFYRDPIAMPAILAPDILLESRGALPSTVRRQNPFMETRPRPARLKFLRAVSQWYPIYAAFELLTALRYALVNAMRLGKRTSTEAEIQPRTVYAAFGACILFHRSYFEAGGSLDFPAFLFGEELFVAESARALGLSIQFDPRLRVVHREHGAVRLLSSRQMARHMRDSLHVLVRTYFS
jgi:GT2 family glycosyltransferase